MDSFYLTKSESLIGILRIDYKLLLVSILLLFTIISLIESNMAVLILGVVMILLGKVFTFFAFSKENHSVSFLIFLIFFLSYSLYSYITNTIYVVHSGNDFFYTLDSLKFYNYSANSIDKVSGLEQIYFDYRSFKAYGFISYYLGLGANYFGENTVFVQKLHVAFLSACIPVTLFNLAKRYFDNNISGLVAVSFGFITHIFTYSAILLRDIHLTLIFTYALYLICQKWKFKYLIVLIFLGLLTSQFRLQNGIFFLVIILLYLYKPFYANKKIVPQLFLFSSLGFVLFLFYGSIQFVLQEDISDKLSSYDDYNNESLESGTGFSGAILGLPSFLKPIASIVLSQIAPVPAYEATYVQTLSKNQYLAFPLIISIFSWVFVQTFFVIGLVKSSFRNIFFKNYYMAFYICVVFLIIVASTSPEYRRLFPVYPMIYLGSSIVIFNISKSFRHQVIIAVSILYLILTFYTLF